MLLYADMLKNGSTKPIQFTAHNKLLCTTHAKRLAKIVAHSPSEQHSPDNYFLVHDRTCHQYVGNIIAALVATAVLSREGVSYYWALIIPAAANATWAIVIYVFLPPHPEEIGLESPKDTEKVRRRPGLRVKLPFLL